MTTNEPGILYAYKCPHCRKIQDWEIGLTDRIQEWYEKCPTCGYDVIIRFDPIKDAVTGYAR